MPKNPPKITLRKDARRGSPVGRSGDATRFRWGQSEPVILIFTSENDIRVRCQTRIGREYPSENDKQGG